MVEALCDGIGVVCGRLASGSVALDMLAYRKQPGLARPRPEPNPELRLLRSAPT